MTTAAPQAAQPAIRLPLFVAQEKAAAGDDQPDWGAARCLFAATATAALVGTPLGLLLGYWAGTGQMAAVPWVGLVQAHGQAQLFGWLGLTILGVTFHAIAHLFQTAPPPARLTWTVLGLQLAGVALRLGAPFMPWTPGGLGAASAWFLVASAVAFLGAFGVTLQAHVRTLPRRSTVRRAPAALPKFLLSGLALWCLALLVNLAGAIQAVRGGTAAAGALGATADALVVALTTGGLSMIALGMSLRVVVGWLDLPAPGLRRASAAWLPLLAALVLRALRPGLQALSPAAGGIVAIAGNALWVVAVFWYLPALRGLWAPEAVRTGGGTGGDADPALTWFVRVAYLWLGVSATLAAGEGLLLLAGDGARAAALADAGRHAVLFGFLGVLTAGLTGRLPTAFLEVGDRGVDASRRAYQGAFWLLIVASTLRVAAPLVAGSWHTAALITAGSAGALAVCCLLVAQAQIARVAVRLGAMRRGGVSGGVIAGSFPTPSAL